MRLERVVLVVFSFLCGAPAFSAESSTVYCCDDGTGHRICGNPLPPQCYNRAYKELSSSGRTTREIDAPLTPEERALKEAADKVRRDAEARIAERRRRDRVLLESYNTVGDIDERRDAVVRGAEKEIETLKRREKELIEERTDLDNRVVALKGKPVPQHIQEDLAANASELKALRGVIAQKQRDADTIRSRFEEDRQRFIELTGKSGGNASPQ